MPRPVGWPTAVGGYSSVRANLRARCLSMKPRVGRKLVVGNFLWTKVSDGLQQGLSPEQVAGTPKRMSEPVRYAEQPAVGGSDRNVLQSARLHL